MNTQQLGVPRHWWGKIVLGVLGLAKGGFVGFVVGLVAGHMLDRFLAGLLDRGRIRRLFIDTLFACLGHLCKADGRVNEAEIAAAERLMARLGLDGDERRSAIARFNAGKARDFDLEGELESFRQATGMQGDLRQLLLEFLLEGAATDGAITGAEQAVLLRAARALRIPAMVFEAMINAFRATHRGGAYTGPQGSAVSLDAAYGTLGVAPDASDADVKRAYRRLVGRYHPDRLLNQDLPEEALEKARNRVAEINTAYDRIKKTRGMK